jgi:hypothetical protein
MPFVWANLAVKQRFYEYFTVSLENKYIVDRGVWGMG